MPGNKKANSIPVISSFLKRVIRYELPLLTAGILIYGVLFYAIDHHFYGPILSNFVLLFAFFKIIYILIYTFKRLTAHLRECCSFYDLVAVYGIVIGLIVFSFAADYYCLQNCLPGAFSGLESANGKPGQAFDFIYFSVVTFATIGFGDITPVLMKAKLLVILEIITSFTMIVFVISNFDKIHQPKEG